jgi:hypothetical protein
MIGLGAGGRGMSILNIFKLTAIARKKIYALKGVDQQKYEEAKGLAEEVEALLLKIVKL